MTSLQVRRGRAASHHASPTALTTIVSQFSTMAAPASAASRIGSEAFDECTAAVIEFLQVSRIASHSPV